MDQFGSFGLISSQTSADALLMDDIEKQLVELEAITTMEVSDRTDPCFRWVSGA